MNALTNSASTNTILALDLGKYKSVAGVHEQATGEIRFTTFETSRAELCNPASYFPTLRAATVKPVGDFDESPRICYTLCPLIIVKTKCCNHGETPSCCHVVVPLEECVLIITSGGTM